MQQEAQPPIELVVTAEGEVEVGVGAVYRAESRMFVVDAQIEQQLARELVIDPDRTARREIALGIEGGAVLEPAARL